MMSINGVSDFKEVYQDEVAMERSKTAIKVARVKAGLTGADVIKRLAEHGIHVGQSTISKYEKPIDDPNSYPPSLEYIRGLHYITGVPMNVLTGISEWGDKDLHVSEENEEILRMINNMSPHNREMAETILYVIYANQHASTTEEIRKIILGE